MEQNYSIEFDIFCERHYVKSFEKKYKSAWPPTRQDIEDVCRRIDKMLEYQRADLIYSVGNYKLVKLDFAVEGTKLSPKSSGNRCILLVDEDFRTIKILLVYSKNDIASPNKTQKWQAIIKKQFPELSGIFNL
ncbi:MAG: hypothetical protein ACREGA_02370 [Candidatus Saccharimonadales bacterium]